MTLLKFYVKVKKQRKKTEGGENMAKNLTNRKPNVKNIRSHALNATKKKQGLNLQVVRLESGKRIRISIKDKKTLLKNVKAA